MPKRTDIKSILMIGAGPIVIGQACEFDYSGVQACKALREEGYRVILVNSNPATIMTDPSIADATYVKPITPEIVELIIINEKPDALLPMMGGQTGLNTSIMLAEMGVLEKHGVATILGPEMKSTGEVMGIDKNFALAFTKSQLGAGNKLPTSGTAFISVKDRDKVAATKIAKRLQNLGFKLIATGDTQWVLAARGLDVTRIKKVFEGRPHCVDAILNEEVQLIVNTTNGVQASSDSFSIRCTAATNNAPHYTTMTEATAAVEGIEALGAAGLEVAPLQAYFGMSF